MTLDTKKGQSLFEVVLAIAVTTLITVGIIIMAVNSIRNSTFSRNKTLASKYAQEAIEWIRKKRDLDVSFFINEVVPLSPYCFNSLSWDNISNCNSNENIPNTNLYREVYLDSVSFPNQVKVEILIYWNDSQGYHEVKSTTILADDREI